MLCSLPVFLAVSQLDGRQVVHAYKRIRWLAAHVPVDVRAQLAKLGRAVSQFGKTVIRVLLAFVFNYNLRIWLVTRLAVDWVVVIRAG